MCEIWKEVEGFDGYFVSSAGRVKNAYGIVNEHRTANRAQIGMKKDGKWGRYDVSRLVAKAFLPNPYNLNTVTHRDGDYHNNRVDNLKWCSRSECPKIVKRRKPVLGVAKEDANYRKRAVFQINVNGEIFCRYSSIQNASRLTGISVNGICRCLSGALTTSGGYKWAYAD